MPKEKSTLLFIILAGFFITNALIAEFIGVKIFSLEETLGLEAFNFSFFGEKGLGFNLTAGVLLWPVVFVMTDVINEYYGTRGVKLLSYMTVGLIIYAFVMIYMAIHLAPNEWWDSVSGGIGDVTDNGATGAGAMGTDVGLGRGIASMDLAFSKVFGQGLWIIVGSLVAFLVGQILDVVIFHRIKKWTGEKRIWLRATGSTLFSQFIDSFVVLLIAFYIGADWPLERVLAIGMVNYIYKFIVAVLLTPVIYAAHILIDNYLGEKIAGQLKSEAAR